MTRKQQRKLVTQSMISISFGESPPDKRQRRRAIAFTNPFDNEPITSHMTSPITPPVRTKRDKRRRRQEIACSTIFDLSDNLHQTYTDIHTGVEIPLGYVSTDTLYDPSAHYSDRSWTLPRNYHSELQTTASALAEAVIRSPRVNTVWGGRREVEKPSLSRSVSVKSDDTLKADNDDFNTQSTTKKWVKNSVIYSDDNKKVQRKQLEVTYKKRYRADLSRGNSKREWTESCGSLDLPATTETDISGVVFRRHLRGIKKVKPRPLSIVSLQGVKFRRGLTSNQSCRY